MQKQPNSRMCFLCGMENPIGLKLFFYTDEQGRCVARYRPLEEHQGYPGSLHGGITTALLDETMGRVLVPDAVWAVTARLEVRFAKPVPLDQELTVVAELVRRRSRTYEARGEVQLPDGTVLAEGRGIYFRLPAEAIPQAQAELGFWEVVPD
jgi:uncharacterized protein (TIGR00369 family)